MVEFEIHRFGDAILRFCARREERSRCQVIIVHARLSSFCYELEGVFTVYSVMLSFRFHLGHLSLSEALPRIVSLVASHLDANKRQLCEGRLLRYAVKAAARTATRSSLGLLLVDIGSLFLPGWLPHDNVVEFIDEWMLDTPMEIKEEEDIIYYDYYYLEDRFGGIPYDGGEGIREEQCIICLEDFDAGAQVTKMSCSHTFHSQCIIHWLQESRVCPLCRHEIPTTSTS